MPKYCNHSNTCVKRTGPKFAPTTRAEENGHMHLTRRSACHVTPDLSLEKAGSRRKIIKKGLPGTEDGMPKIDVSSARTIAVVPLLLLAPSPAARSRVVGIVTIVAIILYDSSCYINQTMWLLHPLCLLLFRRVLLESTTAQHTAHGRHATSQDRGPRPSFCYNSWLRPMPPGATREALYSWSLFSAPCRIKT